MIYYLYEDHHNAACPRSAESFEDLARIILSIPPYTEEDGWMTTPTKLAEMEDIKADLEENGYYTDGCDTWTILTHDRINDMIQELQDIRLKMENDQPL